MEAAIRYLVASLEDPSELQGLDARAIAARAGERGFTFTAADLAAVLEAAAVIEAEELSDQELDQVAGGSTGTSDLNELLFVVVKESVQEANEDRDYWLEKLKQYDQMTSTLRGRLG